MSLDTNYYFCELTCKYFNIAANLLSAHYGVNVEQICSNLENFKSQSFIMNPCEHDEHTFKLPISLVLVRKKDDKLVGHALLNSLEIINSETGKTQRIAYLQGLYIDEDSRGSGLGKKVVLYCERYINRFAFQQTKNRNSLVDCKHLYLSTKDKAYFYEKLNYFKSEPPVIISSSANSKTNTSQCINEKITKNLIDLYKHSGLKVNMLKLKCSDNETISYYLVETCWFRKKISTEIESDDEFLI